MKRPIVIFCCLLLSGLVFLSCSRRYETAGKYEELNPINKDFSIVLDLKPDGKGVWTAGDEVIDFKWEVRGQDIWLHTKSGGVISGRIVEDNSIDITLPGIGNFFLKRVY